MKHGHHNAGISKAGHVACALAALFVCVHCSAIAGVAGFSPADYPAASTSVGADATVALSTPAVDIAVEGCDPDHESLRACLAGVMGPTANPFLPATTSATPASEPSLAH